MGEALVEYIRLGLHWTSGNIRIIRRKES